MTHSGPIVVVVATAASYVAGWLIGSSALMPYLNTTAAWWVMAYELSKGRTGRAIAVMLIWAATLAVASTAMAAMGWATRADGQDLFMRGHYRREMLSWVRTGLGPESTPRVFVPSHVKYAAAFSGLSLASGGVLSMPMGAVLMNSMGDYVGSLARTGSRPWALAILGWHPWAVIRIVGFVIIGVVLSGAVLGRILRFRFSVWSERRWLLIGAALLVLDIALKWTLAPWWGRMLRGMSQ